MRTPWVFVDAVLRQIDDEVVAHPPERGGALLGPAGYPVVSHFLLDDDGHTTSTVYIPSRRISERVAILESAGALELKGVLHSHSGLDRLSSQDEATFGELLALNPHLVRCLAPIATRRPAEADHEVPVRSGKLSCYCIARTRRGEVVERAEWTSVPVLEVTEAVAREVGAADVRMVGPSDAFGALTIDAMFRHPVSGDVVLAFPLAFPLASPTILASSDGVPAYLVSVRWCPDAPAVPQIVRALSDARRPVAKRVIPRARKRDRVRF
jgi:hypothetical protein